MKSHIQIVKDVAGQIKGMDGSGFYSKEDYLELAENIIDTLIEDILENVVGADEEGRIVEAYTTEHGYSQLQEMTKEAKTRNQLRAELRTKLNGYRSL